MKSKILSIGTVISLFLLSALWAEDLLGNWIVKRMPVMPLSIMPMPDMPLPGETVFSFKAEGNKLTGKVTDPQGEAAISDGRINGNKIHFAVVRVIGGKERKLLYEGEVSLNEIRFTCEVQGERGLLQEFVARREFLRHNDYIPRPVVAPARPPREPNRR